MRVVQAREARQTQQARPERAALATPPLLVTPVLVLAQVSTWSGPQPGPCAPIAS